MPPLLIPVIAAAGVSGGITIGAATVSYASIAAYAVSTVAVAGAEYAIGALSSGSKVDVKQNYKQALPARTRAYGYCKLGGAYYVAETIGTTLALGFVHCEGPIFAIVEWWLGDVQAVGITPGALGGTSGRVPGKDKLLFDTQLGTDDQVSNPGLGILPGWGPSRCLKGIANTVMRCYLPSDPSNNFQKYYPSGVPALRVVAMTAIVHDPRDGTSKFTENAGLIVGDYLVHPDGAAIPASRINQASLAAFATVCDGLIARADGSNEPRYRISQGTYDLTEKRADVLKRFLGACDGELHQLPDGTIGIRGGVWADPTVTITADMVTGYTYQAGQDVLTAFDEYRIRYIDVNLDYQQVEGDPWVAPGSTGDVAQDFDARVVPGYNQARRLAKIAWHKLNPQHLLTLNCTMAAIDAYGENIVTLQLPELNLDTTFWVSGFDIAGDCSGCTITLASLSSDAYQWDPSQEANGAPNTNVTPPDLAIPDVSGLALSIVRTAVTGGVGAAQVQAAVAPPVDLSLSLHAQYRVQGAADWTDMGGSGAYTALSGIVNDGAVYEVQAAYQAYGGQDGAFTVDTIDVEVDPAAPGVPQSITATLQAGAAALSAVGPASSNLYALRFYRGASDFASATLIATVYGGGGSTFTYSDASGISGVTHYWATAINHSGVASVPAGPATVSA